VIAWQSQIHRARSKIANIFFVFRVGFSEVFSLSEVASSNLAVRQDYLIETRQVTAISASIESAAAYSSIKAAAKFASKHQRRSPAHVTLYPDAVATFCKRNPVDDGKQSRRRATEANGAAPARGTFPTTLDWKASSIYPLLGLIMCVTK